MTKKAKTEQSKRFIEKAREIEASEGPEAFDRLFSKIVPPNKPKAKKRSVVKGSDRSKSA